MAAEQFITSAYAAIVSWTYILLTILLIVKIVQFFTGGSLFGRGRDGEVGDGERERRGRRPDGEDIGPPERRGHHPNKVLVFQGAHRGDRIDLSWAANPDDEAVNYYWLERRKHARTSRNLPLAGRIAVDCVTLGLAEVNRNLFGNWRRVAYVSTNFPPENPFVDNESFRNHEGIVREWWKSLEPIVPENDYEYRIRAVNSHGKGDWTGIRVSRNHDLQMWMPVIDGVGHDQAEGHVEVRRV